MPDLTTPATGPSGDDHRASDKLGPQPPEEKPGPQAIDLGSPNKEDQIEKPGSDLIKVAVIALLLLFASLLFFVVIGPEIPCSLQPISYSIAAGIILALVGASLGGTAAFRAQLSQTPVVMRIGGGAALLLSGMVMVYTLTIPDCKSTELSLLFKDIPLELKLNPQRSGAPQDPQPTPVNFEFSEEIRNSFSLSDKSRLRNKNIFLNYAAYPPPDKSWNVTVTVGQDTDSLCYLLIEKADRPERGQIQLKGKSTAKGMVFEIAFSEDSIVKRNALYANKNCFKVREEPDNSAVKDAYPVRIVIVDRPIWEKIKIQFRGIFSKTGEYPSVALYIDPVASPTEDPDTERQRGASGSSPPPPPPPAEAPPRPPVPPSAPSAPASPSTAPAAAPAPAPPESVGRLATFWTDKDSLTEDDKAALLDSWPSVKGKVWASLQSTSEPWSDIKKERILQFVRASIRRLDLAWSISRSNRRPRAGQAGTCNENANLDCRRDFAHALPLVETDNDRRAIFNLLRYEGQKVRIAAQLIVRNYPHDGFGTLFDSYKSAPTDPRNSERFARVAASAVYYYYNQLVENQWNKVLDSSSALDALFNKGIEWAGLLNANSSEQKVSFGLIRYGRATVLIDHRHLKTPAMNEAAESTIRQDVEFLARLDPASVDEYPQPHHIARAFAYLKGGWPAVTEFDKFNIDDFELSAAGDIVVTKKLYDAFLRPVILPKDGALSASNTLRENQRVHVLISNNRWDYVYVNEQVGWIKRHSQD